MKSWIQCTVFIGILSRVFNIKIVLTSWACSDKCKLEKTSLHHWVVRGSAKYITKLQYIILIIILLVDKVQIWQVLTVVHIIIQEKYTDFVLTDITLDTSSGVDKLKVSTVLYCTVPSLCTLLVFPFDWITLLKAIKIYNELASAFSQGKNINGG